MKHRTHTLIQTHSLVLYYDASRRDLENYNPPHAIAAPHQRECLYILPDYLLDAGI
jgi:hypothetical protein